MWAASASAAAHGVTYAYDDDNNLTSAASRGEDTAEVEYRYCYTGRGQISRIDAPTDTGAHSIEVTDDGSCDLTGNGTDNDTVFTYNADDELHTVTRPQGQSETFTYDVLSRIKTVTDARGVTTTYTYDALDRVTSAAYTQSGASTPELEVTWTHDRAGNLVEIDDGNGLNAFTYDAVNRKTSDENSPPQGPVTQATYDYDNAGNVTTIEENQPGTLGGTSSYVTTYAYDKVNRVTELVDPRSHTRPIEFDYDRKDNRKLTRFPVGPANADDGGGNADIMQRSVYNDDGEAVCRYSYRAVDDDANGGGFGTNNGNDCPGNPSADALITYYDYDYDKSVPDPADPTSTISIETSQKQSVTELTGITTAYEYDDLRRLTSAETSTDGGDVVRRFVYGYDTHSNLTMEQASHDTGHATPGLEVGTLWLAHTNADQICATVRLDNADPDPGLDCGTTTAGPGNDPTTRYTHDAAGNLTGTTGGGAGPLAGASFSYNGPGQTATIKPPGGTARAQAYDAVMQDRRTSDGDTSMSYGYAGRTAQTTPATPATSGGGTSTSAHAERFVRDPAGKLVAMLDDTAGDPDALSGATYYLTDDQDSVIATITDAPPTASTPTPATRHLYEPYGQTIRTWTDPAPGTNNSQYSEDGTASAPSSDPNPYGYVSGYTDPTTDLIKFGTRYYVPYLATWTQPDPKKGSAARPLTLNLFSYAWSNPASFSDTSGRYPGEDFVEGVGEGISFGWDFYGEYGGAYLEVLGSQEVQCGLSVATLVGSVVVSGGVGAAAATGLGKLVLGGSVVGGAFTCLG